jgi:quinol monooxygenase YgiN
MWQELRGDQQMIFITAKWDIKPEYADRWPEISRALAEPTRAEPGCLWFDWSRSVDNPNEYVLVAAFRDADAGRVHVNSDHVKAAQKELPPHLAATPKIVSFVVPQDDWSPLVEMAVNAGS